MFKIGSTSQTVAQMTQVHEPAYGGVQITDEPIWAPNTGRGSDGTMIGDIVAYKTTVQVTWPALSFADSQTLRNAIINNGPFFKIAYNDFNATQSNSALVVKTVYCANVPRTIASLNAAFQRHGNIQITFIEQ